jgi:hypothetical protein
MDELYDRCAQAFNGLEIKLSGGRNDHHQARVFSGAVAGKEVMRWYVCDQQRLNYFVILLTDASRDDGVRRILIYHTPEAYGSSTVVEGGLPAEVELFLRTRGA